MHDRAVCPYYGCDEEVCDVGCGYISPHDAKMIIKFCSAQFADCQKYHELTDRHGDQFPAAACAPSPWAAPQRPVGLQPAAPAFGLFCFGVTAALFALRQLPVPQLEIHLLCMVMLLGAVGQIITGLTALRSNPLRAVAFTGLGLFWLSLLAIELLPGAGYGKLPGPLPQVGYLAMWGLFSLIIAQGVDSLARTCRVAFAMLTAFLLLLSLAHATDSTTLRHSAALVGFACALPGLICGLRHGWQEGLRHIVPGLARTQRVR